MEAGSDCWLWGEPTAHPAQAGPGTRKAPMNTSEIAPIISGALSLIAALINLITSIRGR
ncbi:hypothetical protein [Streptomyces chartreusis]|uniref:Uncharacterized protein n=1 Tax=Streptomyces chartreusis TaxID=1969 RepID=A0A7H8TLD9_STRCX|nr:hypothetical protein [Streptomyces chartreusis]QKZ23832.1 hypothetical protein HUT05_44640 [Streptomyces chartreusis]